MPPPSCLESRASEPEANAKPDTALADAPFGAGVVHARIEMCGFAQLVRRAQFEAIGPHLGDGLVTVFSLQADRIAQVPEIARRSETSSPNTLMSERMLALIVPTDAIL